MTATHDDRGPDAEKDDATILTGRETEIAHVDDAEEVGGEAKWSVENQEQPEEEPRSSGTPSERREKDRYESRVDRLLETEVVANDTVSVRLPQHEVVGCPGWSKATKQPVRPKCP